MYVADMCAWVKFVDSFETFTTFDAFSALNYAGPLSILSIPSWDLSCIRTGVNKREVDDGWIRWGGDRQRVRSSEAWF